MVSPALPTIGEAARLAELRGLMALDSGPEPVFDDIARLASQMCGVPIALLTLQDEERQWFKANVGLTGMDETPRAISFCDHVIVDDVLLEVPDATLDPRFATNPLVTGAPGIRFYAGAPLVMPGGARLGTLCVIDRIPRQLDPMQAQTLRSLADIACRALVMRRDLLNRSLAIRSQYEQTLEQREALHRTLVEDQRELVSLAKSDGELVYVNPAYARHFGRTPAQMIGANLFDFVEPADRVAVRALITEVLHTGVGAASENRMLAADGSERWVAWANGIQQGHGQQPLLHSVGRDVTEQRRVEQALRASQAFLMRTGRVAGVGGWEIELASGALTWSDETRRIHEVGPDFRPTLENAIKFYTPESRPVIEAAVRVAIDSGSAWDLELTLLTATGRRIWVRAQGEVELEDGKAARLIGALQDISERKQLEQRVADSERFVRQITDSLPVRIAYVDKDHRYRFVNLAHSRRFGRERDQILGRTRSELTGGATDTIVAPRWKAALAGTVQRYEYDEDIGGQLRRIESQLIPDIADSGEVLGFFATGIDITERTATERALRELTAIFDNTTDFVVQTDWRGNITYMNPAARRATGLTPDEPVTQRNVAEFNPAATNRLFAEVIRPAVQADGVWVGQTTVYAANQREVPVSHVVIAHHDDSGRIGRYSAVMRDISAEVEVQRQQQRQASTLRSVAEAIPAIVAVIGADRRYRFVNSAFERWYGASRDAIVGHTVAEVLGRDDYERSRVSMDKVLAGETVRFERDYTGRSKARNLAITYVPLWLDSGEVDGFVGVAQDISSHRQEELRLVQLTRHDPLTGLLNRAGFEQYLDRHLRDGNGPGLALLCIDLDHFKPVNDQHGHPTGDRVLQLFARRLGSLVRPTDAVARLGGDEFAVVLAGVREGANARVVADKVIAAAHAPFELDALTIQIGASVGLAHGADPTVGWRDLLARADAMLYRAKESGRGRQAGASRL